jgi:carbonic anhydrase/acetyltransferase-like protein (isoleucine patch superfamily)
MPIYELDGVSPKLPEEGRYWIAPNAQVMGDVVLGEDVGIWFGAVLRGDRATMTIGARTNIQDGTVVHTDANVPLTIGEDCTVGHNAIVHGATIGRGVLIGMGATILNHARIGDGCIVGANALVTEGKEFPPNSLIVGSPAKVVRELDPSMRETLLKSAAGYVANWQRYAKGLKQIG